jgi:hypothetical protein
MVSPQALAPVEGGLGIFAGKGAKTANLKMLETAQKMDAAGLDPAGIWGLTGWGKGKDGQWRFEISDKNAHLWHSAKNKLDAEKMIGLKPGGGGFTHPELYEAYPHLKDTTLYQIPPKYNFEGLYHHQKQPDAANAGIGPQIGLKNRFRPDMQATLLHELQHAIQNYEGFGRGANPSEMGPATTAAAAKQRRVQETLSLIEQRQNALERRRMNGEDVIDELRRLSDAYERLAKYRDQEVKPLLNTYEHYRRASGEVEARNVQKRQDYTPALRAAQPPWYTEDVPRAKQTVRY